MKTRKERKEEKRQELISKKHPGAINFELLQKGQVINGEKILNIHLGQKNTYVKIGGVNGFREGYAQHETIENEPCSFVKL